MDFQEATGAVSIVRLRYEQATPTISGSSVMPSVSSLLLLPDNPFWHLLSVWCGESVSQGLGFFSQQCFPRRVNSKSPSVQPSRGYSAKGVQSDRSQYSRFDILGVQFPFLRTLDKFSYFSFLQLLSLLPYLCYNNKYHIIDLGLLDRLPASILVLHDGSNILSIFLLQVTNSIYIYWKYYTGRWQSRPKENLRAPFFQGLPGGEWSGAGW